MIATSKLAAYVKDCAAGCTYDLDRAQVILSRLAGISERECDGGAGNAVVAAKARPNDGVEICDRVAFVDVGVVAASCRSKLLKVELVAFAKVDLKIIR